MVFFIRIKIYIQKISNTSFKKHILGYILKFKQEKKVLLLHMHSEDKPEKLFSKVYTKIFVTAGP